MNTGTKQIWLRHTQSSTWAPRLSTPIFRALSSSLHRHPSAAQSHLHAIQPNLDLPRTRPPLTSNLLLLLFNIILISSFRRTPTPDTWLSRGKMCSACGVNRGPDAPSTAMCRPCVVPVNQATCSSYRGLYCCNCGSRGSATCSSYRGLRCCNCSVRWSAAFCSYRGL